MKKIFFVGNSFTYFNEMPVMFENLAKAGGFEVKTDKVTKGGCILRTYLTKGEEWGDRFYNTFESEDWDYVILQEQSARPAIEESEFASAADELCDLIYKKVLNLYSIRLGPIETILKSLRPLIVHM